MADFQTFVNVASDLLQGRLPSANVFKLLVSKLLGYGILAGACITKLPQYAPVLMATAPGAPVFGTFYVNGRKHPILPNDMLGRVREACSHTVVVVASTHSNLVAALLKIGGCRSAAEDALRNTHPQEPWLSDMFLQILAVTNSHSADGLSPLSIELETYGLLVHAAYGFVQKLQFTMYGETLILAAQNAVLLSLVYKYGKQPGLRAAGITTLFSALTAAVLNGSVSPIWVHRAFDANNLIMIASRVPQIMQNQMSRSTGQLSMITSAINLLGVVVRIFTTLSENGGPAMLRGYIISLCLNLTLVIQILAFSKTANRQLHQAKKRE